MAHTINVTQDDIDHGVRGSSEFCPIARAIKREFPVWTYCSVGNSYLSIARSDDERGWRLPAEAQRFILDFDTNFHKVHPFSFELGEEL